MNPVDVELLDQPAYNQVVGDLTTTFTILVGIYFPSVTGMSNVKQFIFFQIQISLYLNWFAFIRYYGRFEPFGRFGRCPAFDSHWNHMRHPDDQLCLHQRRLSVRSFFRQSTHERQVGCRSTPSWSLDNRNRDGTRMIRPRSRWSSYVMTALDRAGGWNWIIYPTPAEFLTGLSSSSHLFDSVYFRSVEIDCPPFFSNFEVLRIVMVDENWSKLLL